MTKDGAWHVDKRVPVALIAVLIGQFALGAYIAGTMRSAIMTNERDIQANQTQIELMRDASQSQAVQLGRIEENITGLRSDLRRMLSEISEQE